MLTLIFASPVLSPTVATIMPSPVLTAVTLPLAPSTVATPGCEEVKTTWTFSIFLPSASLATAVTAWVSPFLFMAICFGFSSMVATLGPQATSPKTTARLKNFMARIRPP